MCYWVLVPCVLFCQRRKIQLISHKLFQCHYMGFPLGFFNYSVNHSSILSFCHPKHHMIVCSMSVLSLIELSLLGKTIMGASMDNMGHELDHVVYVYTQANIGYRIYKDQRVFDIVFLGGLVQVEQSKFKMSFQPPQRNFLEANETLIPCCHFVTLRKLVVTQLLTFDASPSQIPFRRFLLQSFGWQSWQGKVQSLWFWDICFFKLVQRDNV